MAEVILLGPQRPRPNLLAALGQLGVDGPLAVISAGWQEREGELDELAADVGRPVVDLDLYRRVEAVWRHDPALAAAHRDRQNGLRAGQRLHRLRLAPALDALRAVLEIEEVTTLVQAERDAALAAVRLLDRQHLSAIQRQHRRFAAEQQPSARPAVAAEREQLKAALETTQAVLIAGGHVAVLLNRLRLLDLPALFGDRPLIAWSAGAMALAERVVLFHDHPPQGPGDPEILDAGLGLVPGLLPLPDATTRLALGDRRRVSLLSRRFAPLMPVTLDPGASLRVRGGGVVAATDVSRLGADGRVLPLTPP